MIRVWESASKNWEERVREAADVEGLFRAHGDTVAKWALRLGCPDVELQDAVQEVFLRAHGAMKSFRGEAKVTTWLYRTTRNVVAHKRRKNRFRRFLGGSAQDVAGDICSPLAQPDAALAQREAQLRLEKVLSSMGEKYRAVFVLYELEKRSGDEIAELMDAKVETVWVWLHRARKKFMEQVERLNQEEDVG